MPLSFTKQIKYFEHFHSSFQIFHIINHLLCFLQNHSIYAFATYQTNERFHYEKIGVLQVGLQLGFNCNFKL
jgi:hypothetical protein